MRKYGRNEVKEVNILVNLSKVQIGITLPSSKIYMVFSIIGGHGQYIHISSFGSGDVH